MLLKRGVRVKDNKTQEYGTVFEVCRIAVRVRLDGHDGLLLLSPSAAIFDLSVTGAT